MTLGPAICPSLVTCPTSRSALPSRLDRFGPQRLDGIDDDEIGWRAGLERRQDVGEARLAGERYGRIRQAETFGTQAHLRCCLLAGEVDGAATGARQRCRELQQQRRFADAGFAADEQGRPRDDAPAGDAVELADTGREARRLLRRSLQPLEHDDASAAATRKPGAGWGDGVRLFGERIPLAARGALAGPARRRRPAVLTDEGGLAQLGHR
jgi:hypothetical protein